MSGKEWFSTSHDKGVSQVFQNSWVHPFVDAEDYFADLRREVEATGEGGLIYWIGFEAAGSTPMPVGPSTDTLKPFPNRPPKSTDATWLDLLRAASDKRGVQVRALLNLHPKPDMDPAQPKKYKESNLDLVEELNQLKNCLAINDFRYLWMNGTHHQKLVLVSNASGLIAYCGTCDVQWKRITERWSEVHCKIMGDAAGELFDVFQRRWSEHTEVFKRIGSENSHLKPKADLKITAPQSGNFLMQVSTTYGNPERKNPFRTNVLSASGPARQPVNEPHRVEFSVRVVPIIPVPPIVLYRFGNDFFTEKDPAAPPLIAEARLQAPTYRFAKQGHTGIYHAIATAIQQTKKHIYLEDQYLVCDEKMGSLASMLDLLVAKVKEQEFKKLIILCTRIDDINDEFQGTGWAHRNNFVQSLVNAGGDKVVVCQYQSRSRLGVKDGPRHQGAFYIHSKTWIFDDLFLITGSANCNRRGYSHDSELNVSVYDQNKQFVRNLRINLWKRRLNTEGMGHPTLQDNDLADFLSAAKFWEQPRKNHLTIESNREVSLAPQQFPDVDFETYKAKVTGQSGIPVEVAGWFDSVKMRGMWDLVVDPDGA